MTVVLPRLPRVTRFVRLLTFALIASSGAFVVAASPTVLSTAGSGRATAYAEQNKIVTLDGRTHVVWLDAAADGFWVRGRTLDHASGQWGPVVTIDQAQDNHGGPALTADRAGHLHIVYYPHHAPIRYRQSNRPNDLSAWSPVREFGEELSYPVLVAGADDTLFVTARRGYHDDPEHRQPGGHWEQELWKKPPAGDWQRVATLLRSRHPGYSQFAAGLARGPDHQTLHLNLRIYETSPVPDGKPLNTVGYLRSPDQGQTWTKADGTPVSLPATADTVDVLVADPGPTGPWLGSGPLAVDAAGQPHLIYSANTEEHSALYLATPAPGLGWTRRDLRAYLPEAVRDWRVELGMGGGLTFSADGRATVVAVILRPPPDARGAIASWGHATTEVVRLWSDDGLRSWQSELISPRQADQPHWLANLERATGHHAVPPQPGVIYTAGQSGSGLHDLNLNNEVRWHGARAP